MAKVTVKILGGSFQEKQASTVAEVKRLMGAETHSASVNGVAADDNDTLSDNDFVSLSPAVKGGC